MGQAICLSHMIALALLQFCVVSVSFLKSALARVHNILRTKSPPGKNKWERGEAGRVGKMVAVATQKTLCACWFFSLSPFPAADI